MNVCLNQLKDLQLAIAITRVYEGDQGPVLRKLLEEEVLSIQDRGREDGEDVERAILGMSPVHMYLEFRAEV